MKISRKHAAVLHAALDQWNQNGLLDDKMTNLLREDISVIRFDWKKLAKYSFWFSLICIVIAVGSILADEFFIEFFRDIFNSAIIVKLFGLFAFLLKYIGLLLITAGIFWFAMKRRKKYPQKVFSNEAILFLGVLSTGGLIAQIGSAFDSGSGHFSLLILFSFFVYGALGIFLNSNLVWLFALISLGSWMGTETGYASGWGA